MRLITRIVRSPCKIGRVYLDVLFVYYLKLVKLFRLYIVSGNSSMYVFPSLILIWTSLGRELTCCFILSLCLSKESSIDACRLLSLPVLPGRLSMESSLIGVCLFQNLDVSQMRAHFAGFVFCLLRMPRSIA